MYTSRGFGFHVRAKLKHNKSPPYRVWVTSDAVINPLCTVAPKNERRGRNRSNRKLTYVSVRCSTRYQFTHLPRQKCFERLQLQQSLVSVCERLSRQASRKLVPRHGAFSDLQRAQVPLDQVLAQHSQQLSQNSAHRAEVGTEMERVAVINSRRCQQAGNTH